MDKKAIIKALRDSAQAASNTVADTVSFPVDLIAAGLRKAGVPVPQNAVGGSNWMNEQQFTQPVDEGIPKMVGQTLGMVIPAVGFSQPAQVAAALRKGGENLAAPVRMNKQAGAIVWHGSPHKFDRFDASKIGTGEGAQAYGHGLYLAESPDVARSYQNLKPITDPTDGGFIQARAAFDIGKGNVKKALSWLDDRAAQVQRNAQFLTDKGASELSQIARAKQLLNEGAFEPGQLYKVDLPDEQIARMLDWDKPLSQQSRQVQEFFSDYSRPPGPDTLLGDWLKPRISEGSLIDLDLAKAGVPGIRYLDGFSRDVGKGTSNFVVFPGNENMLRILERNGQPLGLMGVR